MVEMKVLHICAPAKSLYKDLRHTGNAGEVNVITAPDCLDGLTGLYEVEIRHEKTKIA
jgi:hypothetical protein